MRKYQNGYILRLLPLLLYILISHYKISYSFPRCSHRNSMIAKKRRKKERIWWSVANDHISGVQFRRIFCIIRGMFSVTLSEDYKCYRREEISLTRILIHSLKEKYMMLILRLLVTSFLVRWNLELPFDSWMVRMH